MPWMWCMRLTLLQVDASKVTEFPLRRAVRGCWTLARQYALAPRCNKVCGWMVGVKAAWWWWCGLLPFIHSSMHHDTDGDGVQLLRAVMMCERRGLHNGTLPRITPSPSVS